MKHIIISFCLIFSTIILSCKKEEPLLVENSGVPLLSKVIIDNQPCFEYVYNKTNLISEIKSIFYYTIYQYNDKDQIVSTDYYVNYDILSSDPKISATALTRKEWISPNSSNKAYTINYEYNNSEQLIKTTYSRPLSGSSEYSEFSYDGTNRISRQTLHWDKNVSGYIDYSYDMEGNLIKEILYYIPLNGIAELSTTTLYVFDNKRNPYNSFRKEMTPGIYTNLNNIIKETYGIHLSDKQGTEKDQVTETTYTYNDKGYPVSKNTNVEYVYK
jgi:hypothetical protein